MKIPKPIDFEEVFATRIVQGKGQFVFGFDVDGKKVPRFAYVNHARRDEDGKLVGFQRRLNGKRSNEIFELVEDDEALLPTAITICFDPRTKFESLGTPRGFPKMRGQVYGKLIIPIYEDPQHRAGLVVDGQHRLEAIRQSTRRSFLVKASAFISRSVSQQVQQFILINSGKNPSRNLRGELITSVDGFLSPSDRRRRKAARIVLELDRRKRSPFHDRIRMDTKSGNIAANSVEQVVQSSLANGAMAEFRALDEDEFEERATSLMAEFYNAVAEVFPRDWAAPPEKSRLPHGVGITAMGNLMDHITHGYKPRSKVPTKKYFANRLRPLTPYCAWSSGVWDLPDGRCAWNALENTRRDKDRLKRYLQDLYDQKVTYV